MDANITTYTSPAYCCARQQIVIKDGKTERVFYVENVERPWKDTEKSNTKGSSACLLFLSGEPYPWYIKSGWELMRMFSQQVAVDF